MYVALDNKKGNRIYADDAQKYNECYCPVCEELLTHKKGTKKRPHFAHKQNINCFMNLNKDYMSEWHIRMQSYFPKESREYRFEDNNTGEVHIADVFDIKTNTVIEFQHSRIEEEEYLSRTNFHLNNGRRIVWIFDESTEKEKEGCIGKLKHDDLFMPCCTVNGVDTNFLYENKTFKWLYNPRNFLSKGPNIKDISDSYSVFVYTGESEDIVHRIISEEWDFEYVILSVSDTTMTENMSLDSFFISEESILSQDPWKKQIEAKAIEIEQRILMLKENEKKMKDYNRVLRRKAKGLDTDIGKCPHCGGGLELKTARKGRNAGTQFYGCKNYPKCRFTEDA